MSRLGVHREQSTLQRLEPDWYRGNYLLAVAYANVAQASDKDPDLKLPPDLARARELAIAHARSVARAIESALHGIESRQVDAAERSSSDLLTALEPTVLLLLAGALRRWEPRTQDLEPLDRRSLLERLDAGGPISDRAIVDYVSTLRLDYRAQYNLACYFAGLGDDERDAMPSTPTEHPSPPSPESYVRAYSELEEALKAAPVDLVKWALEDPSLEGLRQDRRLGPKLTELAKRLMSEANAPSPPPGSAMNRRPV